LTSMNCIEDIVAWQKARILTREIYRITRRDLFRRDMVLKDQIQKAAVSIVSNIGEGFERNGNKEFLQFLSIAKGSAGELKSQLYVALDQGYISPDEFKPIYSLACETSRVISGLMRYLNRTSLKGSKYKE
jgi:four helix bundle protein